MINKLLLCIAVIIAAVIAVFGSIDSGSDTWYQSLQRSNLTPPDFIFKIVWYNPLRFNDCVCHNWAFL